MDTITFPATLLSVAQRRPGRIPRRHDRLEEEFLFDLRAQRRPGRIPRRHAVIHEEPNPRYPLNEGRGAYPGDTGVGLLRPGEIPHRSTKAGAHTPATHVRDQVLVGHRARSTKAGAHTPATHSIPRPARYPRTRSTKAGAHTPATLELSRCPVPVDARSTKAGAHTPATGPFARLNEGRGAYPGDTRHGRPEDPRKRSTKAGAHTPATPFAVVCRP